MTVVRVGQNFKTYHIMQRKFLLFLKFMVPVFFKASRIQFYAFMLSCFVVTSTDEPVYLECSAVLIDCQKINRASVLGSNFVTSVFVFATNHTLHKTNQE